MAQQFTERYSLPAQTQQTIFIPITISPGYQVVTIVRGWTTNRNVIVSNVYNVQDSNGRRVALTVYNTTQSNLIDQQMFAIVLFVKQIQ